jgi:hypothetical protein
VNGGATWRAAVRPGALGLGLAVVVGAAFEAAPAPWDVTLFGLFLAFTACAYPGAGLAGDGQRGLVAETLFGLAVLACAGLGLSWSPWWLSLGYLAHGAWDAAHHSGLARVRVARWFPPACASFDAAFAAWLAVAHAAPRP